MTRTVDEQIDMVRRAIIEIEELRARVKELEDGQCAACRAKARTLTAIRALDRADHD